jgi:hypothetical protein
MPGMKTETRRGLVAAGAALIALITLATLSPTPQFIVYWITHNQSAATSAANNADKVYIYSGGAAAMFAVGLYGGFELADWLGLEDIWALLLAVGVGVGTAVGVGVLIFIAAY